MNNYYVYAYLREDGTPYYIGKGKDKRAYICRGRPVKKPNDMKNILLLEQNLDEKTAFFKEKEYILLYGRKDNGTGILRNKSNGGEGLSGFNYSDEYRKNMSDILKELFTSGKATAFWKNKTQSDEHRLKNSLANSGENNGMFGRKHSNITKQLIRNKREKYVYTILNIGTKEHIITKNLSLFCRENGLSKTGLGNTLLGKSRTGKIYTQHKGYKIITKEMSRCA